MVAFVKENHLPKWERFYGLFVKPIEVEPSLHFSMSSHAHLGQEGGMKEASRYAQAQMKKKSYKLNTLLSSIVQRRGSNMLRQDLRPKT
jgi:hypothetical protein